MALCKDTGKVRSSKSTAFEYVVRPGTEIAYEGIYRCQCCGVEMVAVGGKPLRLPQRIPSSKSCAHQGWQLLVALSH
jgi:hypothetical protein